MQLIAIVLALSLSLTHTVFAQSGVPLTPQTSRSVVHSEEILSHGSALRKKLNDGLATKRIAQELEIRGISTAEAEMRIAGMTDRELAQIENGTHLEAGGDVIVISLTTILIVVLIILLLK